MGQQTSSNLREQLYRFDFPAWARRVGAHKESLSTHSTEYLFTCQECLSGRLRYNHRKQTWICWSCERTGSLFDLIEQQEKTDFEGALDVVMAMERCGGAGLGPLQLILKNEGARPVEFAARPWPPGVDVLSQVPWHADAWRYLTERRGIAEQIAMGYQLGYGRSGWLANYLVFPIFQGGKMLYWQARAAWDPPDELSGDARKEWVERTGYRKTLNPKNEERYACASDVIFNLEVASAFSQIIVCEGPVDAIKSGTQAVSLLGKTATPQQLQLLRSSGCERFTVYLDSEAREDSAKLCSELSAFANAFEAIPPPGTDPGDWTPSQNAAILQRALRWRPKLDNPSFK